MRFFLLESIDNVIKAFSKKKEWVLHLEVSEHRRSGSNRISQLIWILMQTQFFPP
ncbi:MAG: hypothetical protein ACI83W_002659 [Marinoscillum sp.]